MTVIIKNLCNESMEFKENSSTYIILYLNKNKILVFVYVLLSQIAEHSYILTTDADVKFSPESVEALLDLMTRDGNVGAVCARTHPLGSGLLVWYQVFEYAIGHWLLKVCFFVLLFS
jgi:GT2 family glycosyltransferase